jgi:hypothetical protein
MMPNVSQRAAAPSIDFQQSRPTSFRLACLAEVCATPVGQHPCTPVPGVELGCECAYAAGRMLTLASSANNIGFFTWYTLEAAVFWVVAIVLLVLAIKFLMKRDWLGRKRQEPSAPSAR